MGASVKALVEQFQSASTKHSKVETLEEMRRFVLEHSDFQRLQVGHREGGKDRKYILASGGARQGQGQGRAE